MLWPWKREEHRASATDALVAAIMHAAGGQAVGDHRAIAALETASNLYSSAFAVAAVKTDNPDVEAALTPAFLSLIARSLIRRGEFLGALEVSPRHGLEIHPAGSWDVSGGVGEGSWFYRVDLNGPSGSTSRTLPSASVLHIRYAVDSSRPWRGQAPLESAHLSGTLAANLELRLGEETGGPVGSYLPVPKADATDPDDDSDALADLRSDIRTAAGRQLVVESMSAAWGSGKGEAPSGDWKAHRFGADPPAVLDALRSNVGQAILSACGVPAGIVVDSDGTSQRESWRRFVLGSVASLAALVGAELHAKLDTEVEFSFHDLYARDLVGRSTALSRLVKAKMDLSEARGVCGL